ncbi:MAG: nitrogen fixation protein NifZ [gamma proteobacterium symbiont of Bathyaustriella thionipta]|nr:nitrogen fixation protein NifZ [gamma proteobacterium symbiont of Bathyaustriella thionipta]
MRPRFEFGDAVRVIRNLRNDGTYPGRDTGTLLVRRGSVGYVRDVGTFLQDQLIYSVDFFEEQCMVGCREQELQLASDPWVQNRFEFREKVTPTLPLGIKGEVVAEPGDIGEIEKVLRDMEGGPFYHVRFHGRTLMVSEESLNFSHEETGESL